MEAHQIYILCRWSKADVKACIDILILKSIYRKASALNKCGVPYGNFADSAPKNSYHGNVSRATVKRGSDRSSTIILPYG